MLRLIIWPGQIQGAFILSFNNVPEVLEIFSIFNQMEVMVRYLCSICLRIIGHKLIITRKII
ncbi:MAG: hypothetical protein JSC189_000496 [Candidatus Tokpelaia sp. JSC189]|nr:MAG: hypothetical protein JSC189_000496 [Candidatus Tokpelaia sp. JSC189]